MNCADDGLILWFPFDLYVYQFALCGSWESVGEGNKVRYLL